MDYKKTVIHELTLDNWELQVIKESLAYTMLEEDQSGILYQTAKRLLDELEARK